MNSVILIVPSGYSLKLFIDRVRHRWLVIDEQEDHCVIETCSFHVIFNKDSTIINDYDEEELKLILTNIPDPEFYMCEFNDVGFAKEVLPEITNDPTILVDDDHGQILSGKEFATLLQRK